jgi:hypothetical protein
MEFLQIDSCKKIIKLRITINLSVSDKTIKLWKVSERDKRAEGYNLKEDNGLLRDPNAINSLRVSCHRI